jgi:S-adenosyl methyltransferase
MTEQDSWAELGIRTDIPHPARVYDYMLGGKDKLARASTRWTAITCAAWSRAVISPPRAAARVSSLPSVYWMSRPARLGVVNASRWKVRTSGWSLRLGAQTGCRGRRSPSQPSFGR